MKEYYFGNFISEQRIKHGLSQFQLGKLVGVTNKAVSKWENGSSRPKLSVCEKLADIFGMSLDELLACRYLPVGESNTGVFSTRKSIWRNTYARLLSVYGDNVPAEVLSRYNSEKAAMQNSDLIVYFDFLSKFAQKAQNSNYPLVFRAETCSSFIAWLMGITGCNPLRPHYYCPKCKRIEFHPDVKDGWDLPEKTCECGQRMRKDGHNILCEKFYASMRTHICIDINLPTVFLPDAQKYLIDYFKHDRKLLMFNIPCTDGTISDYRYVLMPKDPQDANPNNISEITYEEYIEKYRSCSSAIALISSSLNNTLYELCRSVNRTPGKIDFLDSSVMEAYKSADIPALLDYGRHSVIPFLKQLKPEQFSDITRTNAFLHGTGVWEHNAEDLLQTNTAMPEELISCREDVFDMINSKMRQHGIDDTGFAMDVMRNTFTGRYKRMGMKPEIHNALKSIDVPEWYIQSMMKIDYLFPKSHIISFLMIDMQLMWFYRNERELFERVVSELSA